MYPVIGALASVVVIGLLSGWTEFGVFPPDPPAGPAVPAVPSPPAASGWQPMLTPTAP